VIESVLRICLSGANRARLAAACDFSWHLPRRGVSDDGGGASAAVEGWSLFRRRTDGRRAAGIADGLVSRHLRAVVHAWTRRRTDRWRFGPAARCCMRARGRRQSVLRCATQGLRGAHSDGTLAWSVATGAAVWNAPACHAGTVFVGSRDGRCTRFERTMERAVGRRYGWAAVCSPAVDAKADGWYVAARTCMSMHLPWMTAPKFAK